MIFFDLILVFFIGICLGSFANVCIYRLPKNKQTITGRSFCPKCKKTIRWFDNIPLISFLLLNGKCRKCHKPISLRYFIVELITGIGFLLIYLNFNNYPTIILLSVLSLIWEDLFHLLSPFCHQISDRSFVINNFQIGICARCFGIYFGVIFFGVCTLLKNKMTNLIEIKNLSVGFYSQGQPKNVVNSISFNISSLLK